MCWFITLGANKKSAGAIEAIDRGRARDGFAIRPSVNPHLAALFPPTDARFEITDGHCSCGLVGRREPDGDDRMRRQAQKKGWSEAKLTRALADSHRAREGFRLRGQRYEAQRRLQELIAGLVQELGSVRLFAHFYKGSQDEEPISGAGSRQIAAAEFLLSDLKEGVLVAVTRRPGAAS